MPWRLVAECLAGRRYQSLTDFLKSFCNVWENAGVFLDGVTIGHAGEVITDGTVNADLADAFAGLLADFRRVLHVMRKEVAQELLGVQVRFVHDRIEIEILV